ALHNGVISISPQLFGSDQLTRVFPQGMKIPVKGTVDSPKLDTSGLLKDNAAGIIGGLIGGNKKNDKNDATSPGGQKQPDNLGGLLNDVLGGNKNKDNNNPPPSDQTPPTTKTKKKQ